MGSQRLYTTISYGIIERKSRPSDSKAVLWRNVWTGIRGVSKIAQDLTLAVDAAYN